MDLRPVLLVVLVLGGLDLVNIIRGQPAPANSGKAIDAASETAEPSQIRDEWSASTGGVKISYCTSCAMKGAFMQVKNYVEQEFPEVPVLGETFPIAPHKVVLKKLVVGAQIGVAVMMFAGDKVLNALKISDPQATDFLVRMKERKFPVLMGTWIVGNMVQNALSSTGAFEVFGAGEKIFSKLDEGRMPGLEELYDSLTRTLEPARLS